MKKRLPAGFIDARTVADGTRFEADVCIVGAGPVGLSMAEALVARGLTVCIVESGGFEYDPAEHELCRGEKAGDATVDPHAIRTRQFGGLSNVWSIIFDRPRIGVRYVPFDPIDLEARAEVPHSGWPFALSELTLFQKRLQGSLFGASAPTADIPAQLELYRQGALKLDELITTRYTLDEVATGFDDMHAGRNLRGVIVF